MIEVKLDGIVEPDEVTLAYRVTRGCYFLLQLVGLNGVLEFEACAMKGEVFQGQALTESLELATVILLDL